MTLFIFVNLLQYYLHTVVAGSVFQDGKAILIGQYLSLGGNSGQSERVNTKDCRPLCIETTLYHVSSSHYTAVSLDYIFHLHGKQRELT